MRCVFLALLLSCFLFMPCGSAYAQVSFFQPPTFSAGSGFVPDFNRDGKPDILSGTAMNLGNADGTFKLGIPIPGSLDPSAVADFNGDGKLL